MLGLGRNAPLMFFLSSDFIAKYDYLSLFDYFCSKIITATQSGYKRDH